MNEQDDNITHFEDWVKYMMSNSDYSEIDIMDFEEYYENLLSIEDNIDAFLDYYNEKHNRIKNRINKSISRAEEQ